MDLETAEPASTRRSLIGAVAAAGVVGAAAATLGAGSAVAAPPPNVPTSSDAELLDAAMRLELTARDLYAVAMGNLSGDVATLARVLMENHKAYAGAIAGAIGRSAQGRNDDVYDLLEAAFDTSDDQAFGRAARDLENTAVATHTALLAQYESIDALELTASILAVEARSATVFTSLAGFASNLDDMLGSDADALELTGGAA